jgi:hypothetical protein
LNPPRLHHIYEHQKPSKVQYFRANSHRKTSNSNQRRRSDSCKTLSFPEERVEEETSLFLADERFLEPTIFESNQRKKKNKKESVFCVCVWCKIFFLQRRERFIGRERRRKKRRPSIAFPAGTSTRDPVRLTRSPSFIAVSPPKTTIPTFSFSRFKAIPFTPLAKTETKWEFDCGGFGKEVMSGSGSERRRGTDCCCD